MALNMREALSQYISAETVKEESIKAPIETVKLEKVGDDKKYVLFLAGVDKGLPLNVTNARTLIDKLGEFAEDWVGKTVEVYAAECQFKGRTVPCVRVLVPK